MEVFSVPADTGNYKGYDALGSLRNEIKHLENELERKTERLNKCAQKNKNYQIAGVATVGLATAGITTNISLYQTMKNQQKQNEKFIAKVEQAQLLQEQSGAELDALWANTDWDKAELIAQQEIDKQFTLAEMKRIHEINNIESRDQDDFARNFKNLSQSDQDLMVRYTKILLYDVPKRSQKDEK